MPPGRPRNPDPRTKRLVVNLTPAELAEVHRRAKESGLSASAWLRGRALGPLEEEIRALKQALDDLQVEMGDMADDMAVERLTEDDGEVE